MLVKEKKSSINKKNLRGFVSRGSYLFIDAIA